MDELRPRKDKAPDEGDRDVSCIKTRPQDTTPDYTSGSPLPGPSLGDVQTIDQASVTPDVSGQERAGDNPRKRSVKEDVMFVLNKRQKGSHNVREAAIANLRQGCRKPAGNHPAGMPDTESPKECRYLSKNSTISGPQEKAASERIFTVEATTPSPVQQDGLTEAERDLFPRNAATSKTETAGKAKFSERVDGKHGLAPGTELRTRSPTGGMWQSGSVVSNQIDEEDDSTDSMECESFAHDSVSQAPDLITPNEQRATSEATDEIIGEKHAIEGADHVSVMRLHDIENTASESPDSEDEFIPADSSYNKHEEDDEQPDQTTHHRPPNSGRGSRNSRSAESTTAAASNTSASDAQSPSTFDTRGRLSPSASPLTTPPDSRSVSRPRIEGRKTADLKEDEAGAIEKLKAMGVMFESDSEDEDQEMEGDDFQPLPPSRVDPLWQRPDRSRNLFEIDPSLDMTDPANRLTAVGILPSSTRPSKKKLMGNLLVYQCAEHKKRFGNPHQEVRRYPEEAPVTTVVQLGIDFDTPGDPQVKMEKATMTFREFLGAPTYPVIEARKDQLVFREKEPVQQLAGRNGRTRRKMEMDIFPFVDGGTQVNQLNGVRLLGARRRHRTAGHQD
ncbi:hypothetical protein A1O7_02999 [Cladophialophora yegresii CBS 114405]|uniref:Uncharacterized protein n=1 Tax=Cladophialophora yegresii CBS 114405 TaxID=1182544 RepID=W9WDB9_9EURO|nr:uncharacterized protein A1O7_02999 [Cladophialophora yegresii CBS 114405]EXJ62561.1 hypothetical protein A1O7_02999 [Cladophialophora yegresii CBS 114405]